MIGVSLAMGLVQGFQNNIAKEEQRRLDGDQRIDAVEDMLLQAQLTGGEDYNAAAGDKLQELITSARSEVKDRKPIDIWGTRTDEIDLDVSQMQGIMNNVAKTGTKIGGISFQTKWTGDAKSSRLFLSELTGWVNDSNIDEKLDAMTDTEFTRLYSSMGSARSAIIDGSAKSSGDNWTMPDVIGYGMIAPGPNGEFSDNYGGLHYLDQYKQQRFGNAPLVTDGKDVADQDETMIQGVATAYAKRNNGESPDSVGAYGIQKDGTQGHSVLLLSGDAQRAQLKIIADNLNTTPMALMLHWQRDFMKLPDITLEEQKNALLGAVKLGMIYRNIDTLDPDTVQGLYTLDDAGIQNAYDKIKQSVDSDDFEQQMFALVAYMSPPDTDQKKPKVWGAMQSEETDTIQKYVLRKIFGEEKAKTANFKQFTDAQFELAGTSKDLEELDKKFLELKIAEEKGGEASTPLAYDAFKAKLEAIFDINKGVFGGLIRDVAGLVVTEAGTLDLNDKKNLTTEYSAELNRRVEAAKKRGEGIGKGEQYAQLEAMRISLAFRMARAADPSGRLSNQDIEQQLKKLGSDWQTIDQARAAISVAIKEFKAKEEQYKIIASYANSQDKATKRDYMVVDAAIAVDYIRRNSNIPTSPSAGASSDQPYDFGPMTIEFGGDLYDRFDMFADEDTGDIKVYDYLTHMPATDENGVPLTGDALKALIERIGNYETNKMRSSRTKIQAP